MPVVINEVEHVAEAPAADRGTGTAEVHGGSAPSPAATQAQTLATIRRETSRKARLWAD